MAILATTATTIPAKAEVVCDKLWIERLLVDGGKLGGTPSAVVVVRPYYEAEDGTKVFAPETERRHYNWHDIFAAAESDQTIAGVMGAVFAAVAKADADATAAALPREPVSEEEEGQGE